MTRADAAWSFDYPSQTKAQWLPTCGWYIFIQGKWESGRVGSEPYLSANLEKRLAAGFADNESSYFFSGARVLFRSRQVFWLDQYLKLIPETEKRLKEGKLVTPQ